MTHQMKQTSFDLPASGPIYDRDRLGNRLALGTEVVTPEYRDDERQHELFAAHSRIADISGHFGHIVAD